jgi:phosphoribosylformimino-5-aminoimidazole carboxamide ribotide isomerase
VIAIPAIDLRDGACVQLVGGSYAEERVRLDDPVAVAHRWAQDGFPRLHVVDLDAATGHGGNAHIIREILREVPCAVQVGGGVRTTARVEELLADGATAVVVGTRAVEDRTWLEELAASAPGAVIVAADVQGRRVTTRGWQRTLPLDVTGFVEDLAAFPLAGILVTAVHVEGRLAGADLRLMEDVVDAAAHPVIASGGVARRRDLDELADRGVAACVIGMALYTGALDPRLLAEEYTT